MGRNCKGLRKVGDEECRGWIVCDSVEGRVWVIETFSSAKKFRVKECRVDDVWPGHEGKGRGEGGRGREGRGWDGGGREKE